MTLSSLCLLPLLPLDEFHITFVLFTTQVLFSHLAAGKITGKSSRTMPLLKIQSSIV